MWENLLMGYSPDAGSAYGSKLNWSESLGWGTLALSFVGGLKGVGVIFGAITPDLINPWLILIASTVTGAVAVGTLAYAKIQRTRLDGGTLEAIYAANDRAIGNDRPVPYPAFLPKGAITVTTTTTVDVASPKPPEIRS